MGFWDYKRTVVTGGAGFLGGFVVDKLTERGADVFIPRRRDYDLTSAEDTRRMYKEGMPQVLIHLAASVGGIRANQKNPGRFFYDNMAIGLNVVEEGRIYGALEKLVLVGTVCSYPKFAAVPFREDDLWNGYPEETNAPYGIAKRALLAMAWGYREQYGMSIIYLIPVNVYGPKDNTDPETSHVIPALVRKFVEAKERDDPNVEVWGSGDATREFLYVEDAAEGITLGGELYDRPAPVNIGTGHEVKIQELAGLISRLTGYRGEMVWDTSRPDGQPRRRLDTTRARTEFSFQAQTSLEQGLRQTIDWYEKTISESPRETR